VLASSAEAVAEYLAPPGIAPVLLLAALIHDLGKPTCKSRDVEGHLRFFDHYEESATIARRVAQRLRLPANRREAVARLCLHHLRPLQLANQEIARPDRPARPITMSALRRLFREVAPDGIGLLLLAIADVRACRGPATTPGFQERIETILDGMLARYLAREEEIGDRPLLTGKDLIAAGYQPGVEFGEVLRRVEDAHAEGRIGTKEEALALAAELLGKKT